MNIDFEARVAVAGSGTIAIGLTTNSPDSRNLRIPGKDAGTIGILGGPYDYGLFYGEKLEMDTFNAPMATNDILGCHVESVVDSGHSYRICKFTVNGNPAGRPCYLEEHDLFPTIMLNSPGAVVDTKFTQKRLVHDTKGNPE